MEVVSISAGNTFVVKIGFAIEEKSLFVSQISMVSYMNATRALRYL